MKNNTPSKVLFDNAANLFSIVPQTKPGIPLFLGTGDKCREWVKIEMKESLLGWAVTWDTEGNGNIEEIYEGSGSFDGILFTGSEYEALEFMRVNS
jgi:hypothetical protein